MFTHLKPCFYDTILTALRISVIGRLDVQLSAEQTLASDERWWRKTDFYVETTSPTLFRNDTKLCILLLFSFRQPSWQKMAYYAYVEEIKILICCSLGLIRTYFLQTAANHHEKVPVLFSSIAHLKDIFQTEGVFLKASNHSVFPFLSLTLIVIPRGIRRGVSMRSYLRVRMRACLSNLIFLFVCV